MDNVSTLCFQENNNNKKNQTIGVRNKTRFLTKSAILLSTTPLHSAQPDMTQSLEKTGVSLLIRYEELRSPRR